MAKSPGKKLTLKKKAIRKLSQADLGKARGGTAGEYSEDTHCGPTCDCTNDCPVNANSGDTNDCTNGSLNITGGTRNHNQAVRA